MRWRWRCARCALQAQLGTTGGPEGAVVETYAGLYCGMVGRYEEALQRLDAALALLRPRPAGDLDRGRVEPQGAAADRSRPVRARPPGARVRAPADRPHPARAARPSRRGIERALGHSGQALLDTARRRARAGRRPACAACTSSSTMPTASDPPPRMQRCDEVLEMALALEFAGVAMKARILRAHAQSRAGDAGAAAAAMHELVAQFGDGAAGRPVLRPGLVARRAGVRGERRRRPGADGARAGRAVGAPTALPNVPEPFRESFLQRNPTNRALLAAADRRLAQ